MLKYWYMRNISRLRSFLAVLAFALAADAPAQTNGTDQRGDTRTAPIDVYLLIDASGALSERTAATDWVCNHLVDGILIAGDRVTVWAMAEKPRQVAALVVESADTKAELKATVRGVTRESASADYPAALREAFAAEAARESRTPIAFALLVSGFGFSEASGLGELLRYSRVEDFPGWKAIIVGLGIGPQARSAATAYIERMDGIEAGSTAQ